MTEYGLIGKKLPYTWSPEIHKEFGLNYKKIELEDEKKLQLFLSEKKFKACNVTIPYKQKVIQYLDEISFDAKRIGAVNTIVNKNGKLYGYNTDIDGFKSALDFANITIENKNILVLGSGGTSKMVQTALVDMNAKSLNIVSRSGQINYDNCYNLTNIQIIINTTPIGMSSFEDKLLIDLDKFSHLESVFDVVYNPIKTLLLQKAEKNNLTISNGLMMLVEQARISRNLFIQSDKTLKPINLDKGYNVYQNLLENKKNVILIGMPGCGKSTIGKLLAKNIGKKFIDTDKEIIDKLNCEIPSIFENFGEDYFRLQEKIIIKEVSEKFSSVVATGGGAILDDENRKNLKKNGVIIYLKRNLQSLDLQNRPLSKNREEIALMFENRKDIYESFADFSIENNKIENTLKEIEKYLGDL